MLQSFPDFELTESNFNNWKRTNNTHCATEAFRCETCLHCVPGIAEAFNAAATFQEFVRLGQQVMDAHASTCWGQRN